MRIFQINKKQCSRCESLDSAQRLEGILKAIIGAAYMFSQSIGAWTWPLIATAAVFVMLSTLVTVGRDRQCQK